MYPNERRIGSKMIYREIKMDPFRPFKETIRILIYEPPTTILGTRGD